MSKMRDTSLEAYAQLENVNAKQRMVYMTILRHGPVSDSDIHKILDWPINRVTPRRGELEKKGLIVSVGKFQSESGRRHHKWIINRPKEDQLRLL